MNIRVHIPTVALYLLFFTRCVAAPSEAPHKVLRIQLFEMGGNLVFLLNGKSYSEQRFLEIMQSKGNETNVPVTVQASTNVPCASLFRVLDVVGEVGFKSVWVVGHPPGKTCLRGTLRASSIFELTPDPDGEILYAPSAAKFWEAEQEARQDGNSLGKEQISEQPPERDK